MEKCENCGIAKRIERSYNAVKDGKFYKVLVYACRNPECVSFGVEDKVRQEIKVIKED